jgi:hypothetical protein
MSVNQTTRGKSAIAQQYLDSIQLTEKIWKIIQEECKDFNNSTIRNISERLYSYQKEFKKVDMDKLFVDKKVESDNEAVFPFGILLWVLKERHTPSTISEEKLQVLIDKLEQSGEEAIAKEIRGYYKESSGGSMIFSKNEYRRINDDIQQFAYTDDNGNKSFEFQQKEGQKTVRQVKGKSTKNGRRIKIQESAPSSKTFQIASTELQPFITGLVTPKRPTTSQQRRRSSQRQQKGGASILRQLAVGFGLMMASVLTVTATSRVSPESHIKLFCETYGGQININTLSREQKIRTAITLKLAEIGVGLNPDIVCRSKEGYYLSNDVTITPGNQIARSDHKDRNGFVVKGSGDFGTFLRWQTFVALNKQVEDTFGTPIWGTLVVDPNFNDFGEYDTRREQRPISAWQDGKTGKVTRAEKRVPVDKMVFNPDNFVLIKKEISPEATKHGLYDMRIVVINSDDMYDPSNRLFGTIEDGKMVPQRNENGELIKTNPNFQVLEQLVKDLPSLVDAHNKNVPNRMNGIPNDR